MNQLGRDQGQERRKVQVEGRKGVKKGRLSGRVWGRAHEGKALCALILIKAGGGCHHHVRFPGQAPSGAGRRGCVGTVCLSGWETRTRRRCRGGAEWRDKRVQHGQDDTTDGRTATATASESGQGEGERRLCPEREHSPDRADQGTPDKITVDPADAMDDTVCILFFSEPRPRPSWAHTNPKSLSSAPQPPHPRIVAPSRPVYIHMRSATGVL
jgi:hypothetical protein